MDFDVLWEFFCHTNSLRCVLWHVTSLFSMIYGLSVEGVRFRRKRGTGGTRRYVDKEAGQD